MKLILWAQESKEVPELAQHGGRLSEPSVHLPHQGWKIQNKLTWAYSDGLLLNAFFSMASSSLQ